MCLVYNPLTDELDYKLIEKQMIETSPVKMIKPLKALIMTDRVFGGAFGLYRFLTNCADINAKITCDFNNAKKLISYIEYDILIFVEYLSNKNNYDIIKYYKQSSSNPKIIMFANIDDIIKSECKRYEIEYMFNRYNNMAEFLKYINDIIG